MRIFLSILLLTFGSLSFAPAGDRDGAIAAMQALPQRFQNGILRLSADEGQPNPQIWYLVARDMSEDAPPRNFTVSAGQVTSQRVALNLRTLLNRPSPINLANVQVDSRDAWDLAQKFSSDQGRRLGSVSYLLQQEGRNAVPIWTVWCYAPDGRYIGVVSFLATNGAIVSDR